MLIPALSCRCRCHLHRGQRGWAVDPGALQVRPLRPPPPAAPLQPPPAGLGMMGGWHPMCRPMLCRAAGSLGQGCPGHLPAHSAFIVHEMVTPPGWKPFSPGSIPLPPHKAGGLHLGAEGVTVGLGPQPHTFVKKHKKSFIKINENPRASAPASSAWVCIAEGAARVLLPTRLQVPGQPGGRGWQGWLPGASRGRPSLVQRCEHLGGPGAAASLAALGFLAGRRQVQVALIAADPWRGTGRVGGG